MEQVTLDYAREHLEDLVARARAGEVVEIADPRFGAVRLLPIATETDAPRPKRIPGRWKGRITIDDDELLADMPESELKLWYGPD